MLGLYMLNMNHMTFHAYSYAYGKNTQCVWDMASEHKLFPALACNKDLKAWHSECVDIYA